MSKLNVELLLKVKAHILEDPHRLAMKKWLSTGLTPGEKYYGDIIGNYIVNSLGDTE